MLDVLAANIDVLATMNVQHIESVAPTVQSVTGVQIRETVPDWLVQRADEIVMADLTPEALQTRMRRGDIYGTDRAEKALANFFRRGNLIALRELALQHVTKAVDRTLTAYMDAKQHRGPLGGARARCRLHQLQQLIADADRARRTCGRRCRRRTLRPARRQR